MAKDEDDKLLDPSYMDRPKISFTVADLFNKNLKPEAALTYHVMTNGFSAFSGLGSLTGAVLYGAGLRRSPLLVTMGTAALGFGAVGSVFGYMGMRAASQNVREGLPAWDEEGLQMRIDGISHNYNARLLDLSSWTGAALAACVLVYAGGPAKLGLSAGRLGAAQAVALGAGVGGFGTMLYVVASKARDAKDDGNE